MLDEQTRRRFIDSAVGARLGLIVPAAVVTEFLVGHPREGARADRVLKLTIQLGVTPEAARRAASLIISATPGMRRAPSAIDGMVAVFGEIYGAVVTSDADDLEALAAAGTGFDVYDPSELDDLFEPA